MTFCNKRLVDQQNSTLDIIDKQFFLKIPLSCCLKIFLYMYVCLEVRATVLFWHLAKIQNKIPFVKMFTRHLKDHIIIYSI